MCDGVANPNNCKTCTHKRNPDGGWCYMLRHEPTGVCGLHSRRARSTTDAIRQLMQLILKDK